MICKSCGEDKPVFQTLNAKPFCEECVKAGMGIVNANACIQHEKALEKKQMRLFKATFSGVWLPGFAIILADNADHAADLLVEKLAEDDLLKDGENIRNNLIDNIKPISMEKPHAVIMWDGDY